LKTAPSGEKKQGPGKLVVRMPGGGNVWGTVVTPELTVGVWQCKGGNNCIEQSEQNGQITKPRRVNKKSGKSKQIRPVKARKTHKGLADGGGGGGGRPNFRATGVKSQGGKTRWGAKKGVKIWLTKRKKGERRVHFQKISFQAPAEP